MDAASSLGYFPAHMAYEHLGLKRWPFPAVPEPDFCDFLADRKRLGQDVDSLLSMLSRQDSSSIHLMWSWYGAGKTHTLYYLANCARDRGKDGPRRLHAIYSEFPKAAKSFVDLYRAFGQGLNMDDLIDAYLEISTASGSDELQRTMLAASPDLVNALHVLVTGTSADQVTAVRWLRGEALPAAEFRRVGISQRIGSSEEASRILTALVRLFTLAARSQDKALCRVIWLLDEFQRIAKLPERVRDEMNTGLHSTFNAAPTGLAIVLSFSGRPQDHLPSWFTTELRDRIGRTKVMVLPPMLPDEAVEFVRDLLTHFRTLEHWDADPFFPFTEAACRAIIEDIKKEEELKPRAIMHTFRAVLQEADLLIEQGKMETISAEFARKVLAEYARPSDLEEDA